MPSRNRTSEHSQSDPRGFLPGEYKGPITYADEIVCEIAEVVGATAFAHLRDSMQTEHATLSKSNRVAILKEVASGLTESPIMEHLVHLIDTDVGTRERVEESMSEPVLEAIRVLAQVGIPDAGSDVFTSTATANSGNDCAYVNALAILGVTGLHFTNTSTSGCDGRTGVSGVRPKNTAVYYDGQAVPTDWAALSYNIARQFYRISTGAPSETAAEVVPKYDIIYHWGCISQNWQTNALGHKVSSWSLHEQWNVIITIAMMWHSVATLKPGGTLCLKVRIFNRAETMGLVGILSLAFEEVRVIPLSRQPCTFSVVFATRCTADHKLRETVLNALRRGMTQEPSDIFVSDFVASHSEQYSRTMCACQVVRTYMHTEKAIRATLFLTCLFYINRLAKHEIKEAECMSLMTTLLSGRYNESLTQFLCRGFVSGLRTMSDDVKTRFIGCMDTKWMADNV